MKRKSPWPLWFCVNLLGGPTVVLAVSPASPEDAPAQTVSSGASEDTLEQVVVTGIRKSLEDSTDRKRKAKQFLENVSAEDVGKLPDNNVVEALAHTTGVQITRQHGEGADLSIRGLQEIGTTINGNAAASGELRSMNHNDENGGTCGGAVIQGGCNDLGATLSDIPAELIKSVTVYKTRTADQIEGGLGGQVDVELRRPLDMADTTTIAGTLRDVHSSIGSLNSPSGSLLAAHRGDLGGGQFGWLVDFAYNVTKYQEQLLVTESPEGFMAGTINGSAPAPDSGLTSAYQVWEGVQQGRVKRPSLSTGIQWRSESGFDTVLEGTYLGNRELSQYNYLQLKTNGETAYFGQQSQDFSNITLQPGTQNISSMTINPTDGGPIALKVVSPYIHSDKDNYHTNLETHWKAARWDLKASMQYDWSKVRVYDFYTVTNLANVQSVDVNFDSPTVPGGAALFTLPPGYSLTDLSNYTLLNFHDDLNNAKSHSIAGRFDATYDISQDGFFRSLQSGLRFTHSNTDKFFGYRDSAPNEGNGVALTDWPAGQPPVLTSVGIPGASVPAWYHLNNAGVYANLGAVRNAILGLDPNCPQCAAASFYSRFDWSTPAPAADADAINHYSDHETSLALYSQFNYGFKAYYPVDGVIGLRATRTYGGSTSGSSVVPLCITNADGSVTCPPTTYSNISASAGYWDVLPSLNAIVHFSEQTQLRAAYTYDVERPPFSQLSPFIALDNNQGSAYGGNPNLKPNKIRSIDLALEHYFGRGGLLSIGAYRKLLSAPFFDYSNIESVPGAPTPVPVYRPYNAGSGVYQGYEFAARGFFEFLPGLWRNFGAGTNGTIYQQFTIKNPDGLANGNYTGSNNAPNVSRYTFNAEVFYSTPVFDARLTYNYRSSYRADPYYNYLTGNIDDRYTEVFRPTSRLDAALSYTPIRQLTWVLEATNLLRNNGSAYWGYVTFPAEYRLEARTIQFGVRFRM